MRALETFPKKKKKLFQSEHFKTPFWCKILGKKRERGKGKEREKG